MPRKSARPENEKEMLRGIGLRIKWVRELANVSQNDLARIFRSDQSKWSKYESGQRQPDPVEMIEFCNKFDVTMDYVFRGRLTAKCNPELALRLAALHPELVLAHDDRG